MNTPANSQGLHAGVVEAGRAWNAPTPPSFNSQEMKMTFAQRRIASAGMALSTARSYLASADDFDAAWRTHCIKEAQRKLDDARFYIRIFEQLQDRRAA
jgi:hypothetical protein